MRVSKAPEKRRAELIQAARFLFDQKGVEKTRVSDIVSRVGVAQGVFYYYFASKDEMIDVVVAQIEQEIKGLANSILHSTEKSFVEKLANFIELYLHLFDQFLGDDETDAKGLNASPLVEHFMMQQEETVFAEHIKTLIKQGVESGDITARYPEATAIILLQGFKTYAEKSLPSRRMIYSIIEQSLGIQKGLLLSFTCISNRKRAKINNKVGEKAQ